MSLKTFLTGTQTIYYESLDELPIWNWEMVHKAKSYKYLCKQGKPDEKAEEVYRKISYTFDKLELPMLKAKRDAAVKIIELLVSIMKDSKDSKKIDEAVTILNAVAVAGEHSDWLYKFDFTETSNQKQLLSLATVAVKKSESLKKNIGKTEQTLNQKVVAIERILNVNINPKDCSVNLFMEYERQAVELMKKRT